MQNVFDGDNLHEMTKPVFWERKKKSTLQRRYNAVAYNADTVITRLGLGSRFFPHQFESVALFPRNAAV